MSNQLTVNGIIKQVFPTETKNNFTFRVMWLTLDAGSQYPQVIEVQAAGQKTGIFDGLKEGDEVTCHINLRGREWTKDGKTSVFNTIQAWKVDKVQSTAPNQQAPVQGQVSPSEVPDDLPF